jgi:hypothetical protein
VLGLAELGAVEGRSRLAGAGPPPRRAESRRGSETSGLGDVDALGLGSREPWRVVTSTRAPRGFARIARELSAPSTGGNLAGAVPHRARAS